MPKNSDFWSFDWQWEDLHPNTRANVEIAGVLLALALCVAFFWWVTSAGIPNGQRCQIPGCDAPATAEKRGSAGYMDSKGGYAWKEGSTYVCGSHANSPNCGRGTCICLGAGMIVVLITLMTKK